MRPTIHSQGSGAIYLLGLLVSPATSLSPWSVTSEDFRYHWWMNSIIVDNQLVISGGEYYSRTLGSGRYGFRQPVLSIDLSTSWTTSNLVINEIGETPPIPAKHPGLFWDASTRSLITFGGDFYTNTALELWKLPVNANVKSNWTRAINASEYRSLGITWPRCPSIAITPSGGIALGGYKDPISASDAKTRGPLFEMTLVNTTNSDNFRRGTDVGAFSNTGGVECGAAHFMPAFGGLVVFLGGLSNGGNSVRSMSEVILYDQNTDKWYTQRATGQIPSGRQTLCMTGAQSTNSSTYEIFIFGGSGLKFFENNTDSTDVYILTLPAFTWIRAGAGTIPRSGSNCHTIKNQMISYGGFNPTDLTASISEKDPWTYGTQIFDLTALAWGSSYNANTDPYVQSKPVIEYYSTNPLHPVWDDDNLGALFTRSAVNSPSGSSTAGGPSPTTSLTPTISPSSVPSKTPVAAIAGGTVAGVVILAVIVASVWFFWLRKTRKGRNQESYERDTFASELPDTVTHYEVSGDFPPEKGSHELVGDEKTPSTKEIRHEMQG